MKEEFVSLKNWLNENEKVDEEQLKKFIIAYYKKNNKIDYSDSLELEWNSTHKFYWAWVKPYNDTQVYKGKSGFSESNAEKNYILASNTLKEKDPAGWLEHEIGHILGYRKGYYKNGNIIAPEDVYGLDHYPNVWSEYIPFTRQMKFLSKTNNAEDLIRFMMKDYEESEANKGKNKNLKKIEEFLIKLYKSKIDKNAKLQNKYNKDRINKNPKKIVRESLESFLYEETKYNELGRFYHLTKKENLKSLLSGIDPKKNIGGHAKTQGGGFYVFSSEEAALEWEGGKSNDTLIEIRTKLNSENFDVEFELHGLDFHEFWNAFLLIIRSLNLKMYVVDKFEYDESDNIKDFILKPLGKDEKFNNPRFYYILSKQGIDKSDIEWKTEATIDLGIAYPSGEKIGWFKIVNFIGDSTELKYMLSSLEKFGFVDKFEEKILPKSKALRYVGPVIKPSRYRLKEADKWGDWKNI